MSIDFNQFRAEPRSDRELKIAMQIVESDMNELIAEARQAGVQCSFYFTPHGVQVEMTRTIKRIV